MSGSRKIVLLGEGGVGKSALVLQFVSSRFVEVYDPTIEDSFTKTLTVDGETYELEIIDTAGTEQFLSSLQALYIKTGDAFILVFSLTSIASCNTLLQLREQIVRRKEADGVDMVDVPLVLVGAKCDLTEARTVPRSHGISLSQAWGNVPYFESSAKKAINVQEVSVDIVRQLIRLDRKNGTLPSMVKQKRKMCTIL